MTVLLLAAAHATHATLELSPENWEAATAGKKVFVKFYAPWCDHCKTMKPTWDRLAEEHIDSEDVLIADVDCIGAGEALCKKHRVTSFPTIRTFQPDAFMQGYLGIDYKGGRSINLLRLHAQSLLPKAKASPLKEVQAAAAAEEAAAATAKAKAKDKALLGKALMALVAIVAVWILLRAATARQ